MIYIFLPERSIVFLWKLDIFLSYSLFYTFSLKFVKIKWCVYMCVKLTQSLSSVSCVYDGLVREQLLSFNSCLSFPIVRNDQVKEINWSDFISINKKKKPSPNEYVLWNTYEICSSSTTDTMNSSLWYDICRCNLRLLLLL